MGTPTMGHEHLLYAYVIVWVLQLGYAGWIVWQWRKTKG